MCHRSLLFHQGIQERDAVPRISWNVEFIEKYFNDIEAEKLFLKFLTHKKTFHSQKLERIFSKWLPACRENLCFSETKLLINLMMSVS
jgi:hypothetical protein